MVFDISEFSLQGKRENQEDKIFCQSKKDYLFFAVSDGMGGHEGGSLASNCAIERFEKDVENFEKIGNISLFLSEELKILDDIVFNLKDNKGKWLNAGATIVICIIQGENLYWASVGDSRLYIYRGGKMLQATRDHNYKLQLDELLSNSMINKEQYDKESKKGELLISHLGMGGLELVDVPNIPLKLYTGDILLVCTDGVYKTLSEQEIKDLIHPMDVAKKCVERIKDLIIKKALKYQDNASAILVKVK